MKTKVSNFGNGIEYDKSAVDWEHFHPVKKTSARERKIDKQVCKPFVDIKGIMSIVKRSGNPPVFQITLFKDFITGVLKDFKKYKIPGDQITVTVVGQIRKD